MPVDMKRSRQDREETRLSSTVPTPLKPIDPAVRLAELEMDIGVERDASRRMNVAVYFTAGDCLRTIRDERLFTVRGHRTFGGYLRKRWRMCDEEADWIIACTDESQRLFRIVRAQAGSPPCAPVPIVD